MPRTGAVYRVTLCDRRGRKIGVLPSLGSTALQYATVINGGGSASLTPSLTLPLYSGKDKRRNLRAWASEIVIERLAGYGNTGQVWAGPVAPPKGDLDSNQLTVSAVPLWAWLAERDIDTPHVYAARDQVDVAADLIEAYTTGLGPAGDIRLKVARIKTGVLVTEQYLPTDNKDPGTAVTDLATATGGFDFDILYGVDPQSGRWTRTWQPYFPQKGRTINRTLTPGRGGLRAFSVQDATQICTRVRGSGQITYTAKASTTVEDEFGIHAQTISLSDSNSVSKLRGQVDDYLKNRLPPVEIVSFQYRISKAIPYGAIQTGDTVPIHVPDADAQGRNRYGWCAYDGHVRVIGQSVTVGSGGDEIVACTAAAPPGGIS